MSLLAPEFRADGSVREWHATADGVETVVNDDYRPSLYVATPDPVREDLAAALADDPKVAGTGVERWYLELGASERDPVLRVDLERTGEVRTLAHELLAHHAVDYAPGTVRLYDVDLAPGFRYCVDTDTAPVPERDLRRVELTLPERAVVDGDLTALRVDGERIVDDSDGRPRNETRKTAADRTVLEALDERFRTVDPDVLVLSTAEIVPLCHERTAEIGFERFRLGRADGYERLAGESTYESYGQVGHSPARYAVPGRAIVDRANSFLLSKAGLPGLLDLVERSWRPIQETARGSIGTILTSIEVREARERDVLAPWNKWDPESFKPVRTLHDADRGGFTFAPEPGVYEDVTEVDFASLYPNIMREYNVSPETVDCDCCEGDDVPGLGYTICERRGFIADVLGGLIDDRAEFKERVAALRERAGDAVPAERDYQAAFPEGDSRADAGLDAGVAFADPDGDEPLAERIAALEGRIDALKWVLVSCFGYQGYRNAKFGRIECHEAINAYAREILLDAKERLEAGGWRVVHGIVDSLWVQPAVTDPESIDRIAADVTDEADIPLEHEADFEWVAFAPLRDGNAGALTRYFGREARSASDDRAGGGATREGEKSDAEDDAFKLRGIEARQRSTTAFVADVQRELIRTFDRERDPEAVCDRLAVALGRLERGAVDPAELVVRQRVSKSLEAYTQRTAAVAALERIRDHGLSRAPGQDVRYVVVDDSRRDAARVRLSFEEPSDYDAEFYRARLVRAAESVVSPLGWDREQIRRYLQDGRDLRLSSFGAR